MNIKALHFLFYLEQQQKVAIKENVESDKFLVIYIRNQMFNSIA